MKIKREGERNEKAQAYLVFFSRANDVSFDLVFFYFILIGDISSTLVDDVSSIRAFFRSCLEIKKLRSEFWIQKTQFSNCFHSKHLKDILKTFIKTFFNPKTPFYKFENPKSNRIKTKFTTPGLIFLTCLNGKVTFIRPSLRET